MKETVWKGLRKIISASKIHLLRSGKQPSILVSSGKMCKSKLPLLPCEAKKYQLMGEMDRSMGIEQSVRGRKYQAL